MHCFPLRYLALVGMIVGMGAEVFGLDTLRVGTNGNISWTGTPIGAAVTSIPPEYKVNRFFTEVGNVPGNLIDLSNLDDPLPRVLIKSVVNAPPELREGQLEQIEQQTLEALAPILGIADIEVTSQDFLSLVLVEFEPGTDLGQATQLVSFAIAPLLREVERQESAEEQESDLECTVETKRFESTAAVTDEWGACETVYQGGIRPDCFRTVCRNRRTGEITYAPGKNENIGAGKPFATQQEDDKYPLGTVTVVLPVTLSPDHVARGENVAHRALGWGGRITAPAIKDVSAADLEASLLELIEPEGAEDAFSRKGIYGALGTFIVLDLGSPIGVNRIRFYPRNTVQSAPQYPFQNDFLRQFELLLHDGQNLVLDGTGRLVPQLEDYEVLMRSTANQEPVIDVQVSPPQAVRFVRVKSIASFPYEIDEFDVFGQGFIGNSRYISHVYDLGGVATWGNISWNETFTDLRTGGGGADGEADDGRCSQESKIFETAADVTDEWGECETTTHYKEGIGYINEWECYQVRCRNDAGGIDITPGKNRGKRVAAKPLAEIPSQVIVRTRTGTDSTPILYKRKNVQRIGEDELSTSLDNPGEQLGRGEYLKLSPQLDANPPFVWDKGEITEDLDFWSPWSAPYLGGGLEGGTPILSPGPRRYIQFSIEFLNDEIDATKVMEQLSIEYLMPPIADDLIAEIYPREVEASESVRFVYAVRALMDIPGVKGFDTFEILTPTRALGIDRIEILAEDEVIATQDLNVDIVLDDDGAPAVQSADGAMHTLPYTFVSANGDTFAIQGVTDRNFIVRFPKISRSEGQNQLLKIHFRGQVLLYSTLFRGQAMLSSQEGSIQRITPGNAALLGDGDLETASDITVLSPAITKGSLIGNFSTLPNPFTPNGDGINDVMEVGYDIVAVTRAAAVEVQVFDLSGRLVRNLYKGGGLSGHYDQQTLPGLAWDGRDRAGERVAPGIYLVSISVEGDAKENRHIKPVALVY